MVWRRHTREKKRNNIRYRKNSPKTAKNHTIMVTNDIKCPDCRQKHSLGDCADFQRMSMRKRWDIVEKLRLCFPCLAPSHGMKDCDQIIMLSSPTEARIR